MQKYSKLEVFEIYNAKSKYTWANNVTTNLPCSFQFSYNFLQMKMHTVNYQAQFTQIL